MNKTLLALVTCAAISMISSCDVHVSGPPHVDPVDGQTTTTTETYDPYTGTSTTTKKTVNY
ncbi:hypothetical protein [Oceaniferula spumae]